VKVFFHSHNGADELLPQLERREIEGALETCTLVAESGAARRIRSYIDRFLSERGWSGEVQVEPPSQITIASMKNKVGLCLQTGGNMSRMYADVLKLQKMYLDSIIGVGAVVLPTANAARLLGDNIANADRLEAELKVFRKVIHMPIALIAFE
jgi:hypothetical protein